MNVDSIPADVLDIFDLVDLPILLVDGHGALTCFNRAAGRIFHLTASATGHPLCQIPLFSEQRDIEKHCARVISDGEPSRHDIRDGERRFLLRIVAYPGGERPTTGALLTFTNVTAFRASIEQAIHERQFTKAILNTVNDPLVVLDADLRVRTANRAFFTMFHVSREEARGSLFAELKHHRWEVPELWTQLKDALAGKAQFQPRAFDHDFPTLGRRTLLLDARPLHEANHQNLLLLTFRDITEHRREETARAQLYAVSMAVNHADALPDLYDTALEALTLALHADRASILLFDVEGVMRFKAWRGLSDHYRQAVEGHSPWKHDDTTPNPILISNVAEGQLDESLKEVIQNEGIGALAFIPISYGGRLLGKFMVYFDQPHALSQDDLTLAHAIAGTLAVGIERSAAQSLLLASERRLTLELADIKLLQQISAQMIHEENSDELYKHIVDAATTIMHSDFASMQGSYPERGQSGELRLLAFQGFKPKAVTFWHRVRADSHCSCGQAWRTGQRVIVPDVEACDFMAGTDALTTYRDAGIQAVQTTPLRSRRGHIVGMISTHWSHSYDPTERELRLMDILARQAADLIERKQAEEALHQRTTQFETLLSQAPLGVYVVDADFRLRHVNPSAFPFFETIPDLLGQDFDGVMHMLWEKDYADEVVHIFRQTLNTGRPYVTAERIERRRDRGVMEVYEWRVDRILLPDGRFGVVCYFRDIAAHVQARETLAHSEAKFRAIADHLEQLVAERTAGLRALATELNLTEQRERQRLATDLHDHLQQLLVLSKLKLGQSKRLAQTLPACVEAIKQADDVLSQALGYTRTLVTELAPPILKEFGLPAALKWLAGQMHHHQLIVSVDVVDEPPILSEEHAVLVFQSVRELLMNAAKYAESGYAMVRLQVKDRTFRVVVQDKGKGFDMAGVGKQEPTTLSSKFGLFSIRERMNALGGSFELHAEPGKGTTAVLILSVAELHGRSQPVSLVSGNGHPSSQRDQSLSQGAIRLLLVDDHAMIRQGLRSVLEAYSDVQIVGEARDGEEAISLVDALRPNLVVMDITMPKMNGIEATRHIKSRHPTCKVIGLSVNVDGHTQEAMREAGAELLLTKEAAVDELYHAIQSTLGKRLDYSVER